MYNNNNKQTFW